MRTSTFSPTLQASEKNKTANQKQDDERKKH